MTGDLCSRATLPQVFSLTHELRWHESVENQMRHAAAAKAMHGGGNGGYGGPQRFEGGGGGEGAPYGGAPRKYGGGGGPPMKMGMAGDNKRRVDYAGGKRPMRGPRGSL